MIRLFALLVALAVTVLPTSKASATSVTEEITISYTSTGPALLDISNLSFKSASDTILSGLSFLGLTPTSGTTLLTQVAVLDTLQTYTLSFTGSLPLGDGLRSLTPSGTTQTIGTSYSGADGSYSLSLSVSPVPLPASFPLFGLALICLAGFTYHTTRAKRRLATDSKLISAKAA